MSGKCFSVIWFKLRPTSIPTLETYQSVRPGGSLVGDEIEKTCSLNLNNAQVDDSGTYYCALIRSSAMYMGNGSTLAVRECSDDRAYIEILTLSESDGKVQSRCSATLVCLVFRVSEQARVYWVIEHGLTDSGFGDSSESTPDFIRNPITIPGEVWSSGSVCRCAVETESGRNMSKSASKTDADCFPSVWRYVFIPGVLVTMWIHFAVVRWNNNKQRQRFQEER
ncbi:hypothetical protein AOXY_G32705 [Acipenser oxyrinchus oxyrinchus]|uniref:Immunoglobulin V-set domain-containing protein n=1 Tax=Acipenser oxyrinchus oxyrinchus TaxID=40147 RepID=A0AAD8CIM9_ACIOX|nr:hypothetical protein AOXY_G32705 [Acipenser oxyrinchus oxyrinchus]